MALIPEDIIAQVIERNDIVEVISSYMPLKSAGKNFKANCPFHHEKTPSFVVTPSKQIYHCFGCGEGGNVISFVMKQDRMEFPEAVRYLAQKVGLAVPEVTSASPQASHERQQLFDINMLAVEYFHTRLLADPSASAQEARQYLQQRGLTIETVKKFRCGYALNQWDGLIKHLRQKGISLAQMDKAGLIVARDSGQGYYDRFRHRVIFPIFDIRGRAVAFGARALDDSPAKYINSPETAVYTKGCHLFGFNRAKDAVSQEDCVVIVEGYLDCLIPYQAGLENVIAVQGTALTIEQMRLIRRYTHNVVMLFDADKAGQAAMLRSFDGLIEEGLNVTVAHLEEGQDPDSFVRVQGVDALRKLLMKAQTIFDYKLSVLCTQFDRTSIEGRAAISDAMLSTIKRYDNAVVRSGYVKCLADQLGVTEHILLQEMKRPRRTDVRKSFSDKPVELKSVISAATRRVELNILKLLVEELSLREMIKKELALEDLQDPVIRHLVQKIYASMDEDVGITAATLMQQIVEEESKKLLAWLVTQEYMLVGDKNKIRQDCIGRIIKDRTKKWRQHILNEMRQAEQDGNHEKLDELKKKFNQSVKS